MAKELVDGGYKHEIRIEGSSEFREKVRSVLSCLKVANYYDYFRSYIREIVQIDGLTQLREADASIWANEYAVRNPVDAASYFVQKASVMKEYLEGGLYYGGLAEKRSVLKRIEFLGALKERTKDPSTKLECEKLLECWSNSSLVY